MDPVADRTGDRALLLPARPRPRVHGRHAPRGAIGRLLDGVHGCARALAAGGALAVRAAPLRHVRRGGGPWRPGGASGACGLAGPQRRAVRRPMSPRAIVLTSTATRHQFVVHTLSSRLDVVGVWQESKRFAPLN